VWYVWFVFFSDMMLHHCVTVSEYSETTMLSQNVRNHNYPVT